MKITETVIGTLRRHWLQFRRARRLSIESAFQFAVEAHEALDGPRLTGLRFEPPTEDAFTRARVNSDRIGRWLDDETKDKNLLPANFLPALLGGLPLEARAACVEDLLRPLGLGVRTLTGAERVAFNVTELLRAVMSESHDAEHALLALLDGDTPAELHAAQRQFRELQEIAAVAMRKIESALQARGQVLQFGSRAIK